MRVTLFFGVRDSPFALVGIFGFNGYLTTPNDQKYENNYLRFI